MNDYFGHPIKKIITKDIEIDCLAVAGPRIVGLRFKHSGNLFAEVPQIIIPSQYGDYCLFGGHRLWYAPEAMPRSYIPDNEGLVISELQDGLSLDGAIEPATGIHKRMEVLVNPEKPEITINHILVNESIWEIELAPWAISMFRIGGLAILPFRSVSNPQGLLPDRHISLWPYSNVNDSRFRLEDDFIVIKPMPNLPPFKIGTFNPRGWIVYWLDGILFRKSFEVFPNHSHVDFGCNAEIYCNSQFIELESISPLLKLPPGESIRHTEFWQLSDQLDQEFMSDRMIELCRENDS